MDKWNPNKEILEDMLKKLEALPSISKLASYHIPGGGVGSIMHTINDLASGTERGRNIYQSFLEMHYLMCKIEHSK